MKIGGIFSLEIGKALVFMLQNGNERGVEGEVTGRRLQHPKENNSGKGSIG